MNRIKMTLPTKPEYVSLARLTIASVADHMGFSIEDVEDLKVAVSEACTNAVTHSVSPDKTYDVIYEVIPDKLIITVTDAGIGFSPEDVAMPQINGEQLGGGFGLFIIKSLMDRVEIISESGNGTAITMVKNLVEANEI